MAGNLNNLNKKEPKVEKQNPNKKDFTFTDFTGTNL